MKDTKGSTGNFEVGGRRTLGPPKARTWVTRSATWGHEKGHGWSHQVGPWSISPGSLEQNSLSPPPNHHTSKEVCPHQNCESDFTQFATVAQVLSEDGAEFPVETNTNYFCAEEFSGHVQNLTTWDEVSLR